MPTSRRTSSIFFRSSVNSTPSTMTRPRCQFSIRLMQRSSVDLPPPDGPQMTMRSPRMTRRLTSRSAWNSPYHLARPMMSTAISFLVVRIAGAPCGAAGFGGVWVFCSMALRSARAAGVEPPLGVERVARHGESEHEIDDAGKGKAGEQRHRRRPVRIGEGGAHLAKQIEDRHDQHQRGVLEQRDERIDD